MTIVNSGDYVVNDYLGDYLGMNYISLGVTVCGQVLTPWIMWANGIKSKENIIWAGINFWVYVDRNKLEGLCGQVLTQRIVWEGLNCWKLCGQVLIPGIMWTGINSGDYLGRCVHTGDVVKWERMSTLDW